MDLSPSVVLFWLCCALIGGVAGHAKGKAGVGAVLGFVLGPLGVLIAWLGLSDSRPRCPLCKGALESLLVARCRHCAGDLASWRQAAGRPKQTRDPLEAWEEAEALKPGNLKPLIRNKQED